MISKATKPLFRGSVERFDPDSPAAKGTDLRSSVVRHLRNAAIARVENTSLRRVAREIGMSPTGLKKFLQGTAPYSPTLHRLRNWYIRSRADEEGHVDMADASAALSVLLHDLAPGARSEVAHRILESLGDGYVTSGKAHPSWLPGMLSHLEAPAPPVDQQRPSAYGKYAHIAGTSEDFARLKQAEIDLEDRIRH